MSSLVRYVILVEHKANTNDQQGAQNVTDF